MRNETRLNVNTKLILILMTIIFLSNILKAQLPYKVYSPKFNILAGTYNKDLKISLSSETENSRIYYTLDGSKPDINSLLYRQSIELTGDNNDFLIKAITIDTSNIYSMISSSFYRIDYLYDSTKNITNLSLEDYQNYLTGHWIGRCIIPSDWGKPYNVDLKIEPSGHYIDSTLSGFKYPYGDEVYLPVFYYGISEKSEFKKIEVTEKYVFDNECVAKGLLTIVFNSNFNTDTIKKVEFLNKGNVLNLEIWHHGRYGPLIYDLTRVDNLLILDTTKVQCDGLPVNIKEINNLGNLRIYPNPCRNSFSISGIDTQKINNLTIYNAVGECVYSINKDVSSIDVSKLPEGLYLCLLHFDTESYLPVKLMKINR